MASECALLIRHGLVEIFDLSHSLIKHELILRRSYLDSRGVLLIESEEELS